MKLNQKQLAREIDLLAKVKEKQAVLAIVADRHISLIRKAGGGESKRWIAKLVKMPEKTVVVKAHKQLRLFAK